MAKTQYDIYRVETDALPISFVAGRLDEIQSRSSTFAVCRAIEGGRLGYYSSNLASDEEMVKRAAANASFGQETHVRFPAPAPLQKVGVYSDAAASLQAADLAAWGERIVAGTRKEAGEDVIVNVTLEREIVKRTVVNSEGVAYEHADTGVSVFAEITDAREGDIHEVFDLEFGWEPAAVDVDRLARYLCEYYRIGQETVTVPTGKMTVILHPFCVQQFLIPLLVGINGEKVKDGTSPLKGKMGETLLSEAVTLYDDPYWALSGASAPFDAEGVAAKRRPIVDRGVLSSFNHTLETAAALKTDPTGGAGRGDDGKAHAGVFNLMMEPGTTASADLIAASDRVLFLRYLSGSGQANVLAGEFSMGTSSAFLVEKGKLTKRLKKMMVSGNLYDVFKNVEAISSDGLKSFGPAAGWMPFVMLKDVSVSGG